jgi:hypothetical protein
MNKLQVGGCVIEAKRKIAETPGKPVDSGVAVPMYRAHNVRGAAQATWALMSGSNVFWA